MKEKPSTIIICLSGQTIQIVLEDDFQEARCTLSDKDYWIKRTPKDGLQMTRV